jgi:hypothetical protein
LFAFIILVFCLFWKNSLVLSIIFKQIVYFLWFLIFRWNEFLVCREGFYDIFPLRFFLLLFSLCQLFIVSIFNIFFSLVYFLDRVLNFLLCIRYFLICYLMIFFALLCIFLSQRLFLSCRCSSFSRWLFPALCRLFSSFCSFCWSSLC